MVEMKKLYLILGIIFFVLIVAIILIFFKGNEDDWIMDSRGVWIKHGNPFNTPDYVLIQQQLIVCALALYDNYPYENISSQCLGSCNTHAIDIVHVPRTAEDDLEKNQCEAFRRGQLTHFIELDKEGNIVRIV
jgi:hypothetical protein